MKNHPILNTALLLLSALGLMACSSGGGTGGTGIISRGTITEFGSIVVNGTEFDTQDATVVVKGEDMGSGDETILQNLDIGKVVTVIGSGSEEGEDAVANRVIYRNDLKGPVSAIETIDAQTLLITVLGQAVMVNTLTHWVGTSAESLALNDMLEISGFLDDSKTLWATFLEKTGVFQPGFIMEVVGVVFNLNEDLQVFELADLTVDYTDANVEGLPDQKPAENLLVEVEGTIDAIGGELHALKIIPADLLEVEDVDQIEVTGFVTGFTSIYEFFIGNQKVRVNIDAEVVDGAIGDIQPGVKLEAEGRLAEGVLHAWEIEFWEPDQIEVEGMVAEVVSSTRFFVGNQEVSTGPTTTYEDGLPEDIVPGVHVEIKGRLILGLLHADKVSFEPE